MYVGMSCQRVKVAIYPIGRRIDSGCRVGDCG